MANARFLVSATDKSSAMVKILAALLLLVCVVRAVGPATRCLQERDIHFISPLQEEDSKAQEQNGKEKVEEEQVFIESGFVIAASSLQLIKHPFESPQFIPVSHHEPFCPPPNASHS